MFGFYKSQPILRRPGLFTLYYLYHIAIGQFAGDRNVAAINPSATALIADIRVNSVGEVDWRCSLWQVLNIARWRKDEYTAFKEIKFEGLTQIGR